MRAEPRLFIGERLYRIDLAFDKLIEIGNVDNRIGIAELNETKHGYSGLFDLQTGSIVQPGSSNTPVEVTIPRVIIEEGYEEGSPFAENFNKRLSDTYGIRLIDQKALIELEDLPLRHTIRELPAFSYDGFTYEVDVAMNCLRLKDRPLESIAIDDLTKENGKYLFYQDEDGLLWPYNVDNCKRHELEALVKIVPDEVSRVYGIPKDELPVDDADLRSAPDRIRSRIDEGRLPLIRIVDEDYFVDTRLGELRSYSMFWKNITLDTFHEDDQGHYLYFYDYLNRSTVHVPGDITEMPRHTVLVMLPDLITMDPVATGRSLCNDPYYLLKDYPVQTRMEARIIPLEQTWLPQLIERNLRNAKKPEQKVQNKGTPSRRRGMGL